MYRTLCLLCLINLIASTPDHLFGQTSLPADCSTSLFQQKLPKPPKEIWEAEPGYVMSKRQEQGDTLQSYYYTADALRLTKETIGSLLGTPASPVTGLKHLTFDARVIELNERLVFSSALITLEADQIIFGPKGAIIFTSTPQDSGDGVVLVANSVDFSHGAKHPFQFTTGRR